MATTDRPRKPRVENDPQAATAANAISRHLDEVVRNARERILAEPTYQRMSADELKDVTALLYANFRMLLSAMAGQVVKREQLDYVGVHVRKRVRSGISLEAVLEAYRIGLNVFWEECTAEVAAGGLTRDAAVTLARKMSEAMDTLTTFAAAAYVREESYLRATREKAARDLLEALIRGDTDTSRFEPQNVAPGLDPEADLVVIVSRVRTDASNLVAALDISAAALTDRLATHRASPLLVVREHAIVAIVRADVIDVQSDLLVSTRTALAVEHGIELYCGVSSPCIGFDGVAAAYEQASLAVSRASPERPVISLAFMPAIQHLLTGATRTTRLQLIEKAIAITNLPANALMTMRETLFAFAQANMNVTRAAAGLYIHENTLRYRLGRIAQQSGHDPRTFDGLLELICLIEIVDAEVPPHDHLNARSA